MKASFAKTDITPPLGTRKIGWIKRLVADRILDPLFARVAVFESGGERLAVVQLDTLSIRWTQVADIRRRVFEQYGFPAHRVMVTATHNHAGPAVAGTGEVPREDAYIETMVQKIVGAFGEALSSLQPAEIGFGHTFEWNIAHNRRVIMRDGVTRTHGRFSDPNSLCFEGPIDPEVAVIAARQPGGAWLGCLVNFACHPTHHGGDGTISAGFPGVFAQTMKQRGCPVSMFLNGAAGNISTSNPVNNLNMSMEDAGRALAEDAGRVIEQMTFRPEVALSSAAQTIQLPFRNATEAEIKGTVRGAQRFVDPSIYDRNIPVLLEKIRRRGTNPAEVQALFLDEYALVAIPAEYFVELGLRIKEEAWPRRALVVGYANGMVGYVPTREAFTRGGYETTFGPSSRLAPEAGDRLARCAVEVIHQARKTGA